MASVTSICNQALANIGKPAINSIDDADPVAVMCKRHFDQARDVVLSSYPWRWAETRVALAEITNDRDTTWGYAYQRPNDCLRIRRVVGDIDIDRLTDPDLAAYTAPYRSPDGITYALAGTTIYTNISPAWLEYIQQVTDVSQYPPLVVNALAWQLTARIAYPLTTDSKMRADAYNAAATGLVAAQVADANEVQETTDFMSGALAAR